MSAQDNLQTLRDAQSPFSVFAAINNVARIPLSDLTKEVRVVTAATLGTTNISPTTSTHSGIVVLANLTALTGPLTISSPTYELYLPKLVDLAQNLTVTANTVLTTFKAPLLASIAATKTLSVNGSSALATVDFGSLTTLSGSLHITASPALQAAAFPALTTIGVASTLYLYNLTNAALTSLSFPSLTGSGSLFVSILSKVTSISLPLLATAYKLSIYTNAALTSVNLPSLTAVTGGYGGGNLEIYGNPVMTTFSAPELTSVTGSLRFHTCPALTSVNLPRLTTAAAALFGWDNPALTSVSCPLLVTTDSIDLQRCSQLTTVSLPKLNPIKDLRLADCTQLTSLMLTDATSITGEFNLSNTGFTSLVMPGITTLGPSAYVTLGQQMTSASFANLTTSTGNIVGYGMALLTSLNLQGLTGPMETNLNIQDLAAPLTVNLGTVGSLDSSITLRGNTNWTTPVTLNAPNCTSLYGSLNFVNAGKVTLNLAPSLSMNGSLNLSYSERTASELIELLDYLSSRINGGWGYIYLYEPCAGWNEGAGPWSNQAMFNALNSLENAFGGFVEYGGPP